MPIRFDHQLPEFVAAVSKLRAAASRDGIEFTTADDGGFRTAADTARIIAYRTNDYAAAAKADPRVAAIPIAKWRPITPFGGSAHNWGAARDLTPIKWPAGKSAAWALARLGELAPAAGLKWGGLFNGGTPARPWDGPHFELAMPVTEMRRRWVQLFGEPSKPAAPSAPIAAGAAAAILLPVLVVAALLVAFGAPHPRA